MQKNMVQTFSKAKSSLIAVLAFFFVFATNVLAQQAAVLDLSGVGDQVKTEVSGAAPVIAVVLGLVIAIGITISVLKRAR